MSDYKQNMIAVDFDYLTDDNRVIERCYIGKRYTTLAWKVGDYIYRNLSDAYYEHFGKHIDDIQHVWLYGNGNGSGVILK